jgi:hypothetical protein
MITPASVARHIAQIAELARVAGRDLSRLDATHFHEPSPLDEKRQDATTTTDPPRLVLADVVPHLIHVERRQEGATSPDLSRRDATAPGILEKHVARLEGEVEFLREENATKNAQIKELTERSRETNLLSAECSGCSRRSSVRQTRIHRSPIVHRFERCDRGAVHNRRFRWERTV